MNNESKLGQSGTSFSGRNIFEEVKARAVDEGRNTCTDFIELRPLTGKFAARKRELDAERFHAAVNGAIEAGIQMFVDNENPLADTSVPPQEL